MIRGFRRKQTNLHIRLFIPWHPLWMLLNIIIINNLWRCLYLLIWWWMNNWRWKIISCFRYIAWKIVCKWIKKLWCPFVFFENKDNFQLKKKKNNIPCLLVVSIVSSAKRKPVKRPSRWNVFGAAIGRWYSLTSSSIVALVPPVRFAFYWNK